MANAVYTQFKDRGAKTSGQVIKVPIEFVDEGPNVRTEFDEQHIIDIAKSINLFGQEEPAHGYHENGRVILTRGANRRRAILLTKELFPENPTTTIDILPCEKKTGSDLAREQYIENNKRRPLSPVESARVFEQMKNDGWSIEKISESTGETPSFISSHLALLTAPESILKAVKDKGISKTAATITARAKPEKKAILAGMVASGIKVRVADAQIVTTGHAAQIPATLIEAVMKKCYENAKNCRDNALSDIRWDLGYQICQVLLGKMTFEEIE